MREMKRTATVAASVPIIALRRRAFDGPGHSPMTEMSYNEDAILKMDVAFCARMRAAMEAGLEYAPSTEPGTKNPKFLSDLTTR